MPLPLDHAKVWIASLNKLRFADDAFADFDAVIAYLDRRGCEPFQGNWVKADQALTRLLEQAPPADRQRVARLQDTACKQFFMTVIRQTGYPELSAYASEDAELIAGFLALGERNAFAEGMKAAYDAGRFPPAG
jgi:hypothetical protein